MLTKRYLRFTITNVLQTGAVRWPPPGFKVATAQSAFENPSGVARSMRLLSINKSKAAASRPSLARQGKGVRQTQLLGNNPLLNLFVFVEQVGAALILEKALGTDERLVSAHSPFVTLMVPAKHSTWSMDLVKSSLSTAKSSWTKVANTLVGLKQWLGMCIYIYDYI